MDQELLYSNFILTMKFLNNKQRSKPDQQPFQYANLVLNHFIECKHMFAQTTQVYKVLLNYYEERWILKEEVGIDQTDSQIFIHQMHKENQVNANACQFVVHLLIVGLNSLMGKDIEKSVIKKMKQMYNQLKFALIFQNQSLTDILKPFVQKLLKQIQSFQFYQNLLKIFKQIENFSIITLLQKAISDFRQQWNKNQEQIKQNFTYKKKNRQHALIPSFKQITSLSKDPKNKENNPDKDHYRQAYRTTEKKAEVLKTNIKSIKMAKPKPINSRQSFHHPKNYQFSPHASMSSFDSSQESLSLDQIKFNQQVSRMTFHGGIGRRKLQQIDEDCLCEGTPEKMKKKKK